MKKKLLLAIVFILNLSLFAQERRDPPISFETLFGNERVAMMLGLNKTIAGKFRYNNITSTAAYYDFYHDRPPMNFGRTELVSVNSIIYQFHKNVGFSAGTQYHFVKGFIPNVAVHFSYANPTWLFLLTPYYNFMPWANMETAAVVEYKPVLSNSLKLFTRFQGFYGHNFEKKERERAMTYFRLGLTFLKYTAGIGANIDFYTPARSEIQNYGGFVRVDF
ncbi:MAG: hypothetical protein GX102_10565 [Porphyromonadaceae bacterium]|nr:hypothetical protein [Porphyromonadaceae bacterium]